MVNSEHNDTVTKEMSFMQLGLVTDPGIGVQVPNHTLPSLTPH